MNTLDGIIDTVSAPHEISSLLPLLKTNGKLILLGVPTEPHTFSAGAVLFKRCMLSRGTLLEILSHSPSTQLCMCIRFSCNLSYL